MSDTSDAHATAADEEFLDRWRFEDLQRSYNHRHASDQTDVFLSLIAEEARRHAPPIRAIDIGCGKGMGRNPERTRRVRSLFGEFWGVEPDEKIEPIPGIFTNFQNALLETADLPSSYFDLAYSRMVMEHVSDPLPFFRTLHGILKPGGTYIFLTVNGRHYFARITKLLSTLKLEDAVLRALLGKAGSAYHYPVAYKCNRPDEITRICRETGFEDPDFVFIERYGPRPYFPGPLRPILHAMNRKRDFIRRPDVLLELIGRVRKPG